MKRLYIFFLAFFICGTALAQSVALTPSVTPSLFGPSDEITVTYDVTGTSLASLTSAYIWVWIPGATAIDAKYNVTPADGDPAKTDNAKFMKATADGKTIFSITFTPSAFFEDDISNQSKLGMLLKGNDWSNGQTTDFVTDFWDGSFTINLISPIQQPLFVDQNEQIHVQAEVPAPANFQLYVNDVLKNEQNAVVYSYDYTVTESSGSGTIKLVATAGANSEEIEFQYLISGNSPTVARPSGVIAGINYGADHTKAVLCIWAPGKTSAYLRGDFTDWLVLPEYLMNRDGEYFWYELTGLSPGTEYGFQYLIDEELFLADPYADKILDPDDQYISSSVYPSLKPYPDEARSDKWYFNRVAVLQTGQVPYAWQTSDYTPPAKESMVIYELLIRDFFGADERTYANLVDTISYFKRLGVNAVQLMPIMEFNGNESWGYNPAFMFAPDKYYGPKNKLKEFIDKCHAEGIAVLFDIAMNHQDLPNPYVLMDFDFSTGKPKATNKWFHETARHPFNVFFDMNHSSPYAKAYLDTVNHYWLNEYKIDGFRFDLSKGFSSVNYCTTPNCNSDAEVNAWSSRDQSRIDNLKRMADAIWEHTPEAIVILEHLAVNVEEKELAEYRAEEGKGMMLWGNMNHAFTEIAMGYPEDVYRTSFESRGWTVPHLVSYMESHDEERLAYKNKKYGNASGIYTAKDQNTSMERIKATSVIFYSVPGPKMLWQFGEIGYDYGINTCTDGTENNDCRISPKPVKWDYLNEGSRIGLFMHTSDLIRLHTAYSVFTNGTATISTGTGLVKQVQVKNMPYTETPTSTDEMNVQSVANLSMSNETVSIGFPHTGTWYDYYNGGAAINVTSLPFELSIERGGYRLFTDVEIGAGPVTGVEQPFYSGTSLVYPNPTTGKVKISEDGVRNLKLIDLRGMEYQPKREGRTIDLSALPDGVYILIQQDARGNKSVSKIIKQ
jgi:1,4-alpha-glucan branching enzyme